MVGVIDSGIWPEHASFADDGSYAPLAGYEDLACDFGDTAHNPDDAAFECNNKLLGAYDMRTAYKAGIGPEVYNSARDYDGHGTHTASTAAGNAEVDRVDLRHPPRHRLRRRAACAGDRLLGVR